MLFLCPVLKKKSCYLGERACHTLASQFPPRDTVYLSMVGLHSEYWGNMGTAVHKTSCYNICIIYEATFQICILKPQSLFALQNKMPELSIAFCVHQNAGKYHRRQSSIQVTGTDMAFLFENMIIYDVLLLCNSF